MDVNKVANEILEELGYNYIDFIFKKERHRFPHAIYAYSEKEATDIIMIEGNNPSLARFGLAMLIVHELSHFEYRRKNDPHIDEDYTKEFKEIERKLIEKFWEICLKEHENEKKKK